MDQSGEMQNDVHRWPFYVAAIAGLALFVILRCVVRGHWFFEASCIIVGVLGVVLVVTLPICVLTLLGRQPVMTLSPLVPTSRQRARWREMRQRPETSDSDFYQQFYSDSGIAEEIPLRLRGLYAEQLGISRVLPHDKATDFDEELDFGDLLFEVAEEFSIGFSDDEAKDLACEGTFDAVVHCVASKPWTKWGEFHFRPNSSGVVGQAIQRRRTGMLLGLLVAGVVVIGIGVLLGWLGELVPGLSLVMKVAGIGLVIAALIRGDYRVQD